MIRTLASTSFKPDDNEIVFRKKLIKKSGWSLLNSNFNVS